MRRGQLIIIYFIVYVSALVTVTLELITLDIARRELQKIDLAIEIAGNKTAQTLKNHVYEEEAEKLLVNTFIYTYSALMDETEGYELSSNADLIDRIYVGVNGQILRDYSPLMEVTDSDELAIYIVLRDISIYTPFRTFIVSREYYREIGR